MAGEWFRSGEWTEDARLDFEERLSRARRSGRAQYLRIKALALIDANQPKAAETLLRRVVDEYPDDWLQGAASHEHLGNIRRAASDLDGSAREYRAAITKSPTLNGTTGEVHLALGEAILEADSTNYAEVVRLLAEARPHLTLNSSLFRWSVLKARVALVDGDRATAREAAKPALALTAASSQFSRHPTVGRPTPPASLVAELRSIADG